MRKTKPFLRAPAGKENDLAYWKDTTERMIDMVESYRRRQDSCVFDLGKAQAHPELAEVIIEGILGQTLAVSKKRVKDREEALDVAVGALRILKDEARAAEALSEMERLCPDLFKSDDSTESCDKTITQEDPEIE
jgi:hypothetical protein